MTRAVAGEIDLEILQRPAFLPFSDRGHQEVNGGGRPRMAPSLSSRLGLLVRVGHKATAPKALCQGVVPAGIEEGDLETKVEIPRPDMRVVRRRGCGDEKRRHEPTDHNKTVAQVTENRCQLK